jgi:peptidoglycan hydrolase CwlO-like protein
MTVPSFHRSLNATIGRIFDDRCRSRCGASFRAKWLARRPSGRDTETKIAALKEVVANAKAAIEQRRQDADVLPSEMAEQLAVNDQLQAALDKLQAEINAYWQQVVRNYL